MVHRPNPLITEIWEEQLVVPSSRGNPKHPKLPMIGCACWRWVSISEEEIGAYCRPYWSRAIFASPSREEPVPQKYSALFLSGWPICKGVTLLPKYFSTIAKLVGPQPAPQKVSEHPSRVFVAHLGSV